jgi:hypothetical protein
MTCTLETQNVLVENDEAESGRPWKRPVPPRPPRRAKRNANSQTETKTVTPTSRLATEKSHSRERTPERSTEKLHCTKTPPTTHHNERPLATIYQNETQVHDNDRIHATTHQRERTLATTHHSDRQHTTTNHPNNHSDLPLQLNVSLAPVSRPPPPPPAASRHCKHCTMSQQNFQPPERLDKASNTEKSCSGNKPSSA